MRGKERKSRKESHGSKVQVDLQVLTTTNSNSLKLSRKNEITAYTILELHHVSPSNTV